VRSGKDVDFSKVGKATTAAGEEDTFGQDYQIDASRVAKGSVYLVGALGDMLEDVNRATDVGTFHISRKEGGPSTPFLQIPGARAAM